MNISSIKKIIKNPQQNKEQVGHKRDNNREIGFITYAFLAVFIMLILYLGLFVSLQSYNVINNPYNKRQAILEERYIRGDILSDDGTILATTVANNDEYTRIYPFDKVFSHIVGYSTHGVLGIERIDNYKLLKCSNNAFSRIKNDLTGQKNKADSVYTTLNVAVQTAAYDALGDYKGAVIATNVKTGEILAVVSKPDFNPNDIIYEWEELYNDNVYSPLLNRAFLGLYPPGSTFKIVTTLEYLKENNNNINNYDFDCTGSFAYDGSVINCYHGNSHGNVDYVKSFAKSCNSSFANITSTLKKKEFNRTCEQLLFMQELPIDFATSIGVVELGDNTNTADMLQTGIGQGKTLVSPIQMNMITSAIANEGVLYKPYIVDCIKSSSGRIVEDNNPHEYGQLMENEQAEILMELMREVVTSGTGTKALDTNGYYIGGKTGSAEYSSDKSLSHAWFTGYGTNDVDTIAVTVIVEAGGSGGEVAAPIAKRVFDAYYE